MVSINKATIIKARLISNQLTIQMTVLFLLKMLILVLMMLNLLITLKNVEKLQE